MGEDADRGHKTVQQFARARERTERCSEKRELLLRKGRETKYKREHCANDGRGKGNKIQKGALRQRRTSASRRAQRLANNDERGREGNTRCGPMSERAVRVIVTVTSAGISNCLSLGVAAREGEGKR